MSGRATTPMVNFATVKQQPISQALLDTLRGAIIMGQLKPGQALIQSQLATQFGVSRAPLRDALNRLEEEGLVKSTPYKGTVVTPLTRKDVDEIRSLRNVIEEFAGQLIIERLEQPQLDAIEAVYRRMQAAAAQGDVTAVDAEDLALHEKICELSGHTLLMDVWNRYANQFRRVLTFCNRVNEDLHLIVDNHEPLLQAFRTGDRAALRNFYTNHGTDLTAYLPATWQDDGAWDADGDADLPDAFSSPTLLAGAGDGSRRP